MQCRCLLTFDDHYEPVGPKRATVAEQASLKPYFQVNIKKIQKKSDLKVGSMLGDERFFVYHVSMCSSRPAINFIKR